MKSRNYIEEGNQPRLIGSNGTRTGLDGIKRPVLELRDYKPRWWLELLKELDK